MHLSNKGKKKVNNCGAVVKVKIPDLRGISQKFQNEHLQYQQIKHSMKKPNKLPPMQRPKRHQDSHHSLHSQEEDYLQHFPLDPIAAAAEDPSSFAPRPQDVKVKVLNPWIYKETHKDYLQTIKGLPARHAKLIQKHQKVMREKTFLHDHSVLNQKKGNDAQGKRILQSQYEIFNDPSLPPVRNLMRFDVWEDDKNPEEWIEHCKQTEGPHAFSPVFDKNQYVWKEVIVTGYDEDSKKYFIKVVENGQLKSVQRLSLLFMDENKQDFEERLSRCKELQSGVETQLRFTDLVDSIPSDEVSRLQKQWKEAIVNRCVRETDRYNPDQYVQKFKHLIRVVEEEYIRQMKKCIILRDMKDPKQHPKFEELRVPIRIQKKVVPQKGVVFVEPYNFKLAFEQIVAIHWSQNQTLVTMTKVFSNKCHEFMDQYYYQTDIAALQLPLELRDMNKIQNAFHKAMRQKIIIQWRQFLVGQIQDKVKGDYINFFQADKDQYLESALRPIIKRFQMILNTFLRRFVRQSVEKWVEFIRKFTVPKINQLWPRSQIPMLRISLHVQGGPSKKKDDKKKDDKKKNSKKDEVDDSAYLINFKPSLEKCESFLSNAFHQMIRSTQEIANLESDLVPFVSMPQQPCFNVNQKFPWFEEAFAQVKQMFEESRQGPLQLMERFKKYEYVLNISSKDMVSKLWKEKPTIETLRTQLEHLFTVISQIQLLSTDEVYFPMFVVQTAGLKDYIIKRAQRLMDNVTKKISDFCSESVTVIHQTFKEMNTKIMKKPQDEKQLVDLKKFIAEAPKMVENLQDKGKDVYDHMLILEDFLFRYPEKDSQMYFFTKQWPLEILAAISQGKHNISIEEVNFTNRLDQEKDKFYKDVEKYQQMFEKIKKFSDFENVREHATDVFTLDDLLKKAEEQVESFNIREELFGQPRNEYDEFKKMVQAFKPFAQLWGIAHEVDLDFKQWKTGAFIKIDAEEISQKVDRWNSEAFQLYKKLNDDFPQAAQVSQDLRKEIQEFSVHVPLIKALRTQAMKEEEWVELKERTEVSWLDPNQQLTLQRMIDQKLGNHIEIIEEVSVKAAKKFKLEKDLILMKIEWKDINFELFPYKGTTHVLKGIDVVQTKLDDHTMTTQSMLGSQFMKGKLRQVTREWEKKLMEIQETLQEVMKTQRSWMYLEPIFGSDDITKKMPTEAAKFEWVDNLWRTTMEDSAISPGVLDLVERQNIRMNFEQANIKLDQIQKNLDDYLREKREGFPRFFFLADDDLLQILAQTKDPTLVQAHMSKCFEGINNVRFSEKQQVMGMISAENQEVNFIKPVDVNQGDKKGNVELWLLQVEQQMIKTLTELTKRSHVEHGVTKRTQWVIQWPGQIILTVNQLEWTSGVEQAIKKHKQNGLARFKEKLDSELSDIVILVRGDLSQMARMTLAAMVVIDVHARDVVQQLVRKGVRQNNDFDWIAQLRYYQKDNNELTVCMVNAVLYYGYEYLGNSARLVITPLTDRCYRTLMGAKHLNYGGAPEGPAGTGKTESVKDLAKALAVQCVVFNCQDGLDYLAMAKFFKGLGTSGAWCCFDEFNRIDLQVLSVIAQQILIIQTAISNYGTRSKTFNLDGKPLKLNPQCAINITMNPGYAGRSELPDNLKALFRPCAMMVPDYSLIAEIMLYSYGFQQARNLARKVVASLRLSSEQLSTQDHYDFGMRALKAILVAAGSLRRKLTLEENKLALRALHDVNLPKFTMNDITLFLGITNDLFPNVELPAPDYGSLQTAIRDSSIEKSLQPQENFINKCIQLYETIMVRHGLMVVGRAFAGKSSIIKVLQSAYEKVKDEPYFEPVQTTYINPKSVTSTQLYGNFDEDTHEWTDGVLAITIRNCAESQTIDKKWVIFDGPVDAVWIENMNTVLDDNKKLCLSSGQIIKLKPTMNIMFEVEDLAVASPATVSRCGMVFLEPDILGHEVVVRTYCAKNAELFDKNEDAIQDMIMWFGNTSVAFLHRKGKLPLPQHTNYIIDSMLNILDSYLAPFKEEDAKVPKDLIEIFPNYMLFAVVWSFGAALDETSRQQFHQFILKMIAGNDVKLQFRLDLADDWEPKTYKIKLLECKTIFELYFDPGKNIWINWIKTIPPYVIPKEAQFHQLTIPTVDSIRLAKVFSMLAKNGKHTLFVGLTGTGKTISIVGEMNNKKNFPNEQYVNIILNFSAQTSANQTQDIIDGKMEKRRRGHFGPSMKRKAVVFVDDLNMPNPEIYGAQPPIELLRQWMDYGGWYDIHAGERDFRNIEDLLFVAAMGPPSGGRNPISGRYVRHYNVVYVEPYQESSLIYIFQNIMQWYFSTTQNPSYPRSIEQLKDTCVDSTIEVYNEVSKRLRPTPAKSHYTYNLRDVSKVFQGISAANHKGIRNDQQFVKLWAHECQRVFSDRLISDQDRGVFDNILKDVMKSNFKREWAKTVDVQPILFGNFVPMIYPDDDKTKKPLSNLYCELSDHKLLRTKIEDFLQDYNTIPKFTRMNLVIFMAAIEHVVKINRIISLPFGNALLVGVGGSGRKSMTNLASFITDFQLRSIEISKNYGMKDWHDNMREILKQAGIDARPTVFLLSDTQIAHQGFVEDINNILNNGEIPNLFALPQDMSAVQEGLREMREFKELNDAQIYAKFVERSRQNMHVVLAFSPIGEAFRRRLRMFPSIVNCSTIDWFLPWPNEALKSVADQFLESQGFENQQAIVSVCVDMQERVAKTSEEYKQEMRRYNYVTPTSYLELINTFKNILKMRRQIIQRNIDRYTKGLNQLSEATTTVLQLEEMLDKLRPQLEKAQEETKKMIEDIAVQQKQVDEKTKSCEVEEKICKEKMNQAQEIENDCKTELAKVEPIYREAVDAVKKLESSDITEIKQTANPNEGTRTVINTLCMLFEVKPEKIRAQTAQQQTQYDYWNNAKKFLLNAKLKDRCISYDKDNIKIEIVQQISPILDTEAYSDKVLKNASKAAYGLGKWVRAMVKYYEASKIIKPKREAYEEAKKQLKEAQDIYAAKKAQLDAVIALMKKLVQQFEKAKAEKERLENQYDECNAKKKRAGQLVEGLADEKERWTESKQDLNSSMGHLVGDVLISSGVIAYLGAFTVHYRNSCINSWLSLLKQFEVNCAANFSLKEVLGDDVKIRDWQLNELPTDDFSTDNAIILENSKRWPLMIDPQMQANIWIRKSEERLGILKPTQSGVEISRILETSIPYGKPILLEDCGQNIDPLLEPLLRKSTFKQGGITYIKLGENPVEYAQQFKFYITTKLSRPHYAPQVCVSVTMLNFMVTEDGLLDQMLNMVVRQQEEKVARQRDAMIIQAAESKKELRNCENQILDLISSTPSDKLLDDDKLIQTLKGSKQKSNQIKKQMEDQKKLMEKNEAVRQTYKVVAFRISQLFFCIMDLGGVEPMYQYSLRWFKEIARLAMLTAQAGKGAKRLQALNATFTRLLYQNVCRSLFEKDKLIFSFLLTIKIMQGGVPQPHLAKKMNRQELLYRGDSRINSTELRYLLTGDTWVDSKKPNPSADEKGNPTWLSEKTWIGIQEMVDTCNQTFAGFDDSFSQNITIWRNIYDSQAPILSQWPEPWQSKLDFFQRLLVVRILRPDRAVSAIQELIVKEMGKQFITPPTFNLQISYNDSKNSTPIIFVLSPGADPIAELQKLAKAKGFGNKWKPLSLGQGQGQFALDSINEALTRGEWVVLQNCHLAPSFMPILEGVVQKIEEDPNSQFRLWLTSMPSQRFPVSILQNGVKLTNQPPKGLRQNMLRSMIGIDPDTFESCQKPQVYKKLLFGLCFFNAVILERRKYGPLGWNIPYEFSQSDLRISQSQLLMFLNEYQEIPWEALIYMVAQANYGGRVTDPMDRRTISIILNLYYTPEILKDQYRFVQGDAKDFYYAPQNGPLQSYIDFIGDKFPINDVTAVFGLHENAQITSAIKDTTNLLSTVLSMMPRAASKGGRSDDEIIDEMAANTLDKLPANFDLQQASKRHPIRKDESMNTVLQQELLRFNKLVTAVRNSLQNLRKAIKGLVTMSGQLEKMITSLFNNQVPDLWVKASYPSLKPLGSYVNDLILRLKFMGDWIDKGAPSSFWISGFYFTQSFLTGTMQNYARKYVIPIDTLQFDYFVILDQKKNDTTQPAPDGVYIHGLFLEGAQWQMKRGHLTDQNPKQLFFEMPPIWLLPKTNVEREKNKKNEHRYQCPVYKTSRRAGTLSTTGHSTNFVLNIQLEMSKAHNMEFWVKRGVAMLTQLDY